MAWARITFGARSFHAAADPTAGDLVTHGPYRFWRHPIYASVVYFVWAGVLSAPAPDSVGVAAVVTGSLVARMLFEEQLLRQHFPDYDAYCARTKRIIPFVL
jgi:protein-S-isoprenylcysteine O-methyltransferase Ste14